jgi:hypothetical protein
MTSSESQAPGGPVLQLLAAGLQFWIRSQCEAVESLELQLHGSALQLLRGQLEGVTLMARRVVYDGLQVELVELRSDPLRVKLGRLVRAQSLTLDHPFGIRGRVAFTATGLTHSLSKPRWRELSDLLGEQLLGLGPLVELRIARDTLILAARAMGENRLMELETRPVAVDGRVEIHAVEGELRASLPMDPNIRITTANLEGGMLQLQGEARVQP